MTKVLKISITTIICYRYAIQGRKLWHEKHKNIGEEIKSFCTGLKILA